MSTNKKKYSMSEEGRDLRVDLALQPHNGYRHIDFEQAVIWMMLNDAERAKLASELIDESYFVTTIFTILFVVIVESSVTNAAFYKGDNPTERAKRKLALDKERAPQLMDYHKILEALDETASIPSMGSSVGTFLEFINLLESGREAIEAHMDISTGRLQ